MLGMQILDLAIVLLIGALGLRTRPTDLLLLFQDRGLGLRAFLALFLFMPACTLLAVWVLPVEAPIRASLLALSVAPLAPILSRARAQTSTKSDLMLGLQVFSALVALVAIPAMLALTETLFDYSTAYPVGTIAWFIIRQIGFPLVAGMGLAWLLGEHRDRVATWLERFGTVALLGGMLLVLFVVMPTVWDLSINGRLFSVVVFTALVLVTGQLFGGSDTGIRHGLVMAGAQRHPGVAFVIATTVLPAEKEPILVILVLFVLVGTLATIPFMLKRSGAGGS
jgi:BASS family bile acid:Na+ symporter